METEEKKYRFNVGDHTSKGYIRAQVVSTTGETGYIISDEPESTFGEGISETNLLQLIERDRLNKIFWEEQDKLAKEEAERRAAAKAKREDTDGFADNMEPMKRARTIKILNTLMRFNGIVMSRKESVRRRIAAGATVKDYGGRRILENQDDSFIGEKEITKTAMDYAEYLLSRNSQ